MASVQFNTLLIDESEPSLCADISEYSDSSSSINTDDEFDIKHILYRRNSISLFNVSTPLEILGRNSQKSVSRTRKMKYKTPEQIKTNHGSEQSLSPKQTNQTQLELSTKYAEALKEIETLQCQILKLKSERSLTPYLARRKSLQSSMIKTCLFKNTSTTFRINQHNSTKSSNFGNDSSCMTDDIEDRSTRDDILVLNNIGNKTNPFVIKSQSPASDKILNNSSEPLISNHTNKSMHTMRSFIGKFLKCPKFLGKIKSKTCTSFNNRISPVPNVLIFSPEANDSGNDSEMQQIRLENCTTNTQNVECIIRDMSKLAEELSEKLKILQKFGEQYLKLKNS